MFEFAMHRLEETRGSYKQLVALFNMAPKDYKRFLSCLRAHECHVEFRRFREAPTPMRRAATILGSAATRQP